MDNTDKIVGLIGECQRMNLKVVPPGVNHCAYKFQALDAKTIIYGLGAIKGVGEGVIQAIVDEREKNGRFDDMNDFCQRVGSQTLNKRVLEAMVLAGALDELGPNRASLFAHIPDAMKAASQQHNAAASGMGDLFGGLDSPDTAIRIPIPELAPWPDDEQLRKERDTLGLYLTGHPIQRYREELKCLTGSTLGELTERIDAPAPGVYSKGVPVLIAGLIMEERLVRQQNGDRQLFLTVDDGSGRTEVSITGDEIDRVQTQLPRDTLAFFEGDASFNNFSGGIRIRCKRWFDLATARQEKARTLLIELTPDCRAEHAQHLIFWLKEQRTKASEPTLGLHCRVLGRGAEALVQLSSQWRLSATDSLIEQLAQQPGIARVRPIYPNATPTQHTENTFE